MGIPLFTGGNAEAGIDVYKRQELEKKYPNAVFLGAKYGEELAGLFASADVFVFPRCV